MKTNLESLFEEVARTELGLQLLDAIIKFTSLLAGLLLVSVLMRSVFKSSAAQRACLIWIGALAVPVIAITSFDNSEAREPVWEVSVADPTQEQDTTTAKTQLPTASVAEPLPGPSVSLEPVASAPPAMFVENVPPTTSEIRPEKAVAETTAVAWDLWALGLWIVGLFAVVARLGLGVLVLNWRTRKNTHASESGRLAQALRRICKELGISRAPVLLIDENESAMPMTWGAMRQKILLPSGAEHWNDERLSFVLRHELGHVRRRDCLAAWAMRLLLAPTWFHPLSWLLSRHATDLRERACDDISTRRAEEVDQYARELVAISRDNCNSLGGALAMARPKRLEGRIRALYCDRVGRSRAGVFFRSVTAAVVGLLVLPAFVFTLFQSTQLLAAPAKKDANTVYLEPSRYVEMRTTTIFHTEDAWEGIETRELEEIDRTVQGWVRKLPTIQLEDAIPMSKADLALLEAKGRALGMSYESEAASMKGPNFGLPRFPEGKTNEGTSLFGMQIAPDSHVNIRDVKVTYLKDRPGKISVTYVADHFDSIINAGTGKPDKSTRVGPIITDNGGGIVLGVSGEDKQEQDEGGIYKLPILRGMAKRSRERLLRYKWVEVIAFRVSEDLDGRGMTRSVSPRPVFGKGSKKVELTAFEFTDTGNAAAGFPEGHMKAAASRINEWSTETAGSILRNGIPATRYEMTILQKMRGVDSEQVPKFTTGKQYTCKVLRQYGFPGGVTKDMGLTAKVKVTSLPNGKLRVELDPRIAYVVQGLTAEEIAVARKNGHAPDREGPVELLGVAKTYTIENGGGIVLGAVGEDIDVITTKVPVLGDVPLLKRVFSSTTENHYRRMMAIQIRVLE